MKQICCICGNAYKFTWTGVTYIALSDGYVCPDCCEAAGYGSGFIDRLKLGAMKTADFVEKYNSIVQPINDSFDIQRYYAQMSNEELQEEMKKFIVYNAAINLKDGELCYFSTECHALKYKDVVVGNSRTSLHMGGGKKMYTGAGLSSQVNKRQIVSEKYPGHFYVTNQRMICNAIKLSFEIPLVQITAMTTYSDGLTIMSGGKSYNVNFVDMDGFKSLITLNNEIEKRNQEEGKINNAQDNSNSYNTNISEADIPKLIREYKMLHEEGIISEEEFQQKKNQLLSKKL